MPALLLCACGTSNTIDSDTASGSSSSANSTMQSISNGQTPEASVEISLIGSVETGDQNTNTPSMGAANPEGVDSIVDALDPQDTVACTAPDQHMQQRTLELINEARAQARMCGTESFTATDPLSWDLKLLQAADRHSRDMTQHNFFDHTGSDGSSIAARVDATGYEWRAVGENIAAGQRSASEVVAGWLNSPGHCRNLMNPVFTQVAVTCVEDNGADYTRYWTNVLATPL